MIIERMSRELSLPLPFVYSMSVTASHQYYSYDIPKRTGGTRTIHHPSRRLKALQRWLLTNVIQYLPVHDAATAYRKGKSIFDNARPHVHSNYLLRLDFINFFPSITALDIKAYAADRGHHFLDWTTGDIEFFCRVVCRRNVLTIGAPTSPGLSNVLCYDLDQEVDNYCRKFDIAYSRYADDLFFSTRAPNILAKLETEVPRICANLRFPTGLVVNPTKIRHSSKRGARRVTGVLLGSDEKMYVGRPLKRLIRAQIHQLEKLTPRERSSLAGLIAYVVGIDPVFLNTMINKYGLRRVRDAQQKM